jgi:cellulose synthase/poly-beta-1,6-N-acetylglucosamine synthase-like glycosyltransferase
LAFVILSTLALVLGLFFTWLVHSRGTLKILVLPDTAQVKPSAPDPLPQISIIVPARNEARNIRQCLEGLLVQNYPNYEIIVVDDRSSDATPLILAEQVR